MASLTLRLLLLQILTMSIPSATIKPTSTITTHSHHNHHYNYKSNYQGINYLITKKKYYPLNYRNVKIHEFIYTFQLSILGRCMANHYNQESITPLTTFSQEPPSSYCNGSWIISDHNTILIYHYKSKSKTFIFLHIQILINPKKYSIQNTPLGCALYNNSIDDPPLALAACLVVIADHQWKHQSLMKKYNYGIQIKTLLLYLITSISQYVLISIQLIIKIITISNASYDITSIPISFPIKITLTNTSSIQYSLFIHSRSYIPIITTPHGPPLIPITSTSLDESQTHTPNTITKTLIYIVSWHIQIQIYKIFVQTSIETDGCL